MAAFIRFSISATIFSCLGRHRAIREIYAPRPASMSISMFIYRANPLFRSACEPRPASLEASPDQAVQCNAAGVLPEALMEKRAMNRLAHESSTLICCVTRINRSTGILGGPRHWRRPRRRTSRSCSRIGYTACHWCHVMERESFSESHTATQMNANFINHRSCRSRGAT